MNLIFELKKKNSNLEKSILSENFLSFGEKMVLIVAPFHAFHPLDPDPSVKLLESKNKIGSLKLGVPLVLQMNGRNQETTSWSWTLHENHRVFNWNLQIHASNH